MRLFNKSCMSRYRNTLSMRKWRVLVKTYRWCMGILKTLFLMMNLMIILRSRESKISLFMLLFMLPWPADFFLILWRTFLKWMMSLLENFTKNWLIKILLFLRSIKKSVFLVIYCLISLIMKKFTLSQSMTSTFIFNIDCKEKFSLTILSLISNYRCYRMNLKEIS